MRICKSVHPLLLVLLVAVLSPAVQGQEATAKESNGREADVERSLQDSRDTDGKKARRKSPSNSNREERETGVDLPSSGLNVTPTATGVTGDTPAEDTVGRAYRIGVGDVLQIDVWREPDASVPSVVVRSDGKISLPLVKELQVLGLTPAELEWLLTRLFSRFIHSPDVTIIVREIHSEKVYVIGAVGATGSIEIQGSMTVLQVLAEVGGLTEYAKKKKIFVLRKDGDKRVRLPFNYEAVIKGESPEQNFLVLPGDTVIVPE